MIDLLLAFLDYVSRTALWHSQMIRGRRASPIDRAVFESVYEACLCSGRYWKARRSDGPRPLSSPLYSVAGLPRKPDSPSRKG